MILWKHPNMRDISFTKRILFRNNIMTKVKLTYYLRIPCTNSYEFMGISEKLSLPNSKIKEWVLA